MGRRLAILLSLAALLAARAPAEDFRFAALLDRITDLDALTVPPAAGTKHVQFSSFDRKSLKGPADPDAWFANADWGKFLCVEETARGKEYVMVDQEGPGILVRIWSANPKGVIRIYLDREKKPLLEHPMADLLDGKVRPFVPPLGGVRSRGHNLYVPIPFAKHLKVTCSKSHFYYHANVLRYPKGTPIESLTGWELARSTDRVLEAARRLAHASGPPRSKKPVPWIHFSLDRRLGTRMDIMTVKRTGTTAAIRDFMVTALEPADRPDVLRKILVIMRFDGAETVRVPLGEFFGNGPRAEPYRGLGSGTVKGPDGPLFYSRFPLPFRRSAVVTLENRSGVRVSGKYHARLDATTLPPDAMRFHAVYREGADLNTRPFRDVNYLDATGTGKVVGCVLTIRNPVQTWWGEGDEKIFVDGEKLPSIFGTGTEDYFGYAWGSSRRFSHAYHAQPTCDGPRNYGLTTVNRFHILDTIPFTKSVRFDLELWHWKACRVDYCTTTFFYAAPGARDRRPFPADRTPHWREPGPYVPARVPGAIEAEELPFEARSGTAEIQGDAVQWSNDRQVWWKEPEIGGGPLVITFDAPKAGRYKVLARFTVARDYGRHQIAINGARPVFEYDFYRPRLGVSKELELGTFRLKKKGNRLVVTCVGKHPEAIDKRMCGIDYIKLMAVR
jgi:hypothetical protein